MTEASRRLVAGIGFATAATADEIICLIEACLAELDATAAQLVAIATHARKLGWATPLIVATHFNVPLRLLDDADLRSPGIAEAVASAAGLLRLPKRKSRYATCAIAECHPDFDIAGFGQPPSPRATIASSIVATSTAGP
jgi:cobalt-precorrin 5A hydrolase/precorrin-3B C17-methyltransferase